MLRKLAVLAVLAGGMSLAAAVTTATPALAKGATRAHITGPGLAHAIVVSDAGEPGQSGKLATLAQQSGLFTVLFGADMDAPAPTPKSVPPKAARGPRYAVVYTVPGVDPKPGQQNGRIRQYLYPYAAGGPLTYTPRGQHGFGQDLQASGWLCGDHGLVHTLNRLGVPAKSAVGPVRQHAAASPAASATRDRSGVPAWPIAVAAIIVAAAGAGVVLWLRRRTVSNQV